MSTLIVCALEAETCGRLEGRDVLYTGVGKVNAAMALTRALTQKNYTRVINLGTAGSAVFKARSVVACTSFIQRDMDVSPLGFVPFQTPYAKEGTVLAYGRAVSGLQEACCGTGDSFDTDHAHTHPWQVVDMEGYALALVCKRLATDFTCIKYVSDGADGAAASDWHAALEDGALALSRALSALEP